MGGGSHDPDLQRRRFVGRAGALALAVLATRPALATLPASQAAERSLVF